MPLRLDQEAHQSRWTYHVLIYPHYPPVWVLLGICLDWELDLEGMTLDLVSSTGVGEQDIEEMEKNLEVKAEEDRVNKE